MDWLLLGPSQPMAGGQGGWWGGTRGRFIQLKNEGLLEMQHLKTWIKSGASEMKTTLRTFCKQVKVSNFVFSLYELQLERNRTSTFAPPISF